MLKGTQTVHCLIIASGLIISSAACKKHTGSDTAGNTGKDVDIYVLGTVDDSIVYWKNGVAHNVSPTLVLDEYGSPAIFASGNNVYIPGIKPNNSNPTFRSFIPLYWQNDAAITLPDSSGDASPSCIFVSNNDVYVGGITDYYKDTSHVPYTTPSAVYPKAGGIATLWKNGVPITLPGHSTVGLVSAGQYAVRSYADYISSLYVTGNDVYVAGGSYFYGYDAGYWKNGVLTDLTKGLIYSVSGNLCFPTTTSIFVSGNDVYVAGYQNTGSNGISLTALYWKNGSASYLADSVSGSSIANSIFVSGNDVYVAGYQNINNHARAICWKNGVATTLTTGTINSEANSIFVKGNDVYVAGFQWTIYGHYIATYWKNGEVVKLTDGTTNNAIAKSIYVQ